MAHKIGTLHVCPLINTMGPVVDARHTDLLGSWGEVDRCLDRLFSKPYREQYPDSSGAALKFSWFTISWSGFKSNPVQRDFGYFNILDHYRQAYGDRMASYGDGVYWMYNHPPASGVGNEWGMDWMQNAQYLEILMRFVAERNWYPAVVQVPTEAQDCSHFLENYFPFDLSNRNAVDIQWAAKNADGKTMAQVIDWRRAPHNWDVYQPADDDYQSRGDMKRHVGRLLDIQSIVYVLTESEIEKAFQRCLEGADVMLSAYEHDFRDRADVIQQRLLEPLTRLSRKYAEVPWLYKNSLEAFQGVTGRQAGTPPELTVARDGHGNLVVRSDAALFGYAPFCFQEVDGAYGLIHPLRIGERSWLIYRTQLPAKGYLHLAAHSPAGVSVLRKLDASSL